MKENIMQVVKLFVVCVISAAILAWVYGFTKEPIEISKKSETMEAIKRVVAGIDDNMIIKDTLVSDDNGEQFNCYLVLNTDSTIYGYAIKTITNKGYGGKIVIILGTDSLFSITGYHPLEFTETPGLGTKMTTDEFKSQFNEKNLSNFNFKVKKDGGDIVAITAATITSRAVGDALEKGLKTLEYNFNKVLIPADSVIPADTTVSEVKDVN